MPPPEELQELPARKEALGNPVDHVWLAGVLHPLGNKHVVHPLKLRPVGVRPLESDQAHLLAMPEPVSWVSLELPLFASLYPGYCVHQPNQEMN